MSIARFTSGAAKPELTTCCLCAEPITPQEATFGPNEHGEVPSIICNVHLSEGRHLITALADYYHRAAATPSPRWVEVGSE